MEQEGIGLFVPPFRAVTKCKSPGPGSVVRPPGQCHPHEASPGPRRGCGALLWGLGSQASGPWISTALQMPASPDHPVFEGLMEMPPPPGGLP